MTPAFGIDPTWLARVLDASRDVGRLAPDRKFAAHRDGVGQWRSTRIRSNATGSVYLHEWTESDHGDMHDHPYDCASIILAGGYWEVTLEGRFWRAPGDVIIRSAEQPHRIEIDPDHPAPVSLFVTGPIRRIFGFHTSRGWMPADQYARERSVRTAA